MEQTAYSPVHSVNVRTLAETYFEGGDLFADLNAMDRMQEGLKGHLLIQNAYPPEYRSEVPVRYECTVAGVNLTVQGRVDGLMLKDGDVTIEEIKTTRFPPSAIQPDDYPVHWAQALIYAHIICQKERMPAATVRLVYCDLTGARTAFTRVYQAETLSALFEEYASVYARRLGRFDEWKRASLPSMRALGFPFSGFRAGQREMAARVYLAIRDRKKVLVEAPTGIGKTAAALFPAVKALGEGRAETVFFLTARTTGRRAAEDALALMRKSGLRLRSVTLSAKKKVCPLPELRCDPAVCGFARGYFDRQQSALEEAWETEALGAETIADIARKYRLCPFELSLALAETAEVVICDYNYVFDPMVRLRRFFDRRGSYALLVDEAHNLVPRARDMYSAELGARDVKAVRREVGRAEGKTSELYKILTEFLKSFEKIDENELRSELPMRLVDACKRFSDEVKTRLSACAPLAKLYFDVLSFVRVSGEFDEASHRTLVAPEEGRSRVKLWCWNPTERLRAAMKRMRGTALFSATLSPPEHYARLLGLREEDGDQYLCLPSPFPPENLLTAILNVPTRYSVRAESAPRVADAIHKMAAARTGNYLACFPSHAYLNQVAEIFAARYPDTRVLLQSRDMSEKAREEYLSRFEDAPQTSMVAFIAMGGVFSEGIDLPGERLIGAAIVGVGLPQLCYEREALSALYEELSGEGEGRKTSYVYPGIGKCLQAAGRVIRTANDRGVVLLIDERYTQPEYRALLPAHYRPRVLTEAGLSRALSAFWSAERR